MSNNKLQLHLIALRIYRLWRHRTRMRRPKARSLGGHATNLSREGQARARGSLIQMRLQCKMRYRLHLLHFHVPGRYNLRYTCVCWYIRYSLLRPCLLIDQPHLRIGLALSIRHFKRFYYKLKSRRSPLKHDASSSHSRRRLARHIRFLQPSRRIEAMRVDQLPYSVCGGAVLVPYLR